MMMGRHGYAHAREESGRNARADERALLARSVRLLEAARGHGALSRPAIEAVYFTNKLWTAFIEDLGGADNRLEPSLRANLISIGLSILRTTGRVRQGDDGAIDEIVDVSNIILEGLS